MATTGSPTGTVRTEVIDTLDNTKTCTDLPDFPTQAVWSPLGGIIDGKIIICGGDTGSGYSTQCHTYAVCFFICSFVCLFVTMVPQFCVHGRHQMRELVCV